MKKIATNKLNFSVLTVLTIFFFNQAVKAQQTFRNSALPLDVRVQNLVSQLTLEEKISLLGYQSKAVLRLGVPAYNWWNEALHGVARAGEATVFPQAIGMAATFDDSLLYQVANVISTEARAKNNLAVAHGNRGQYLGLTFWSPNINIFRDPRWGRGQETYGEDPFLTGQMGLAFVRGMQGSHPRYLKTAACAKHFAVHSGPEANRHSFDAVVDNKDLRETYLPAFEKLVKQGKVESVMGAYNRVNSEPATIGPTLINILRKEWGFGGHLLTDCWALDDIYKNHKVLPNSVAVAAAAIKAGVNLDCSSLLQDDLLKAVQQGLLTEKEIDASLSQLLRTQFRLGFYDDVSKLPWSKYGKDSIRNAAHVQLSRTVAAESMVLLKNEKNLLPLSRSKRQSIMVAGPNAFSAHAMVGNYHGVSRDIVTFLEGITAVVEPGVNVGYEMGAVADDTTKFGGIWATYQYDVVVAVIGLTPLVEGEEGDAFLSRQTGDRSSLALPIGHVVFLQKMRKEHPTKPIIAVVTAGSAMDVKEIEPYVDAIVYAWYPGEQGGHALADILYGKVSPSGRLPLTFYNSVADILAYDNYNMQGRTYRYYNGPLQYPFGFGLSYTDFAYEWKEKPAQSFEEGQSISFSVTVSNKGKIPAKEVVQAYVQYPSGERMPVKELKGFKKVLVNSKATASFSIPISEFKKWDSKTNSWMLPKGTYQLVVGRHSRDESLKTSFVIQ